MGTKKNKYNPPQKNKMLNDNYNMFLHNNNNNNIIPACSFAPIMDSKNYYCHPESPYFSNYRSCYDSDDSLEREQYLRDYLHELEEQNRRRQEYLVYLEQVSMERRKRQEQERRIKLLEEEQKQRQHRHQHLMDLERKQRRYEQEEKQKRQYRRAFLNHRLQQQRKLEEERRKKTNAMALEEALQEGDRFGVVMPRNHHRKMSSQQETHPKQQRFVQGPDGSLYRVLFGTNDDGELQTKNGNDEENTAPGGRGSIDLNESVLHRDRRYKEKRSPVGEQEEIGDTTCSSRGEQEEENVVSSFHKFFNTTRGGDNANVGTLKCKRTEERTNRIVRKKKCHQQRQLNKSSSVLIGDVEEASDSECEDEFNDYWHNRRPRAGKWIEPIHGATKYLQKDKIN